MAGKGRLGLARRIPPTAAPVESRAKGTESLVSPSPAPVSHRPAPVSVLVADVSSLPAPAPRIGFDPVCPRLERGEAAGVPGALSRLLAFGAVARGSEDGLSPPRWPHPSPVTEAVPFARVSSDAHGPAADGCVPNARGCGRWGEGLSHLPALRRRPAPPCRLPSLCPECSHFAAAAPIRAGWAPMAAPTPPLRQRHDRSAGNRDTGAGISYTAAAKWDTGGGARSAPPVAPARHALLSWRSAEEG